MRRAPSLVPSLVLMSVLVPAVLAVPVVSKPSPTPHPVRPTVRTIAVSGVDPMAAHSAVARTDGSRVVTPVALSGADATAPFQTVGATWAPGSLGPNAQTEVRTRGAGGGQWSGWTTLDPMDTAPDAGSKDAKAAAAAGARDVAEPVYVGASDGVQLRVVPKPGAPAGSVHAPSSLKVVLVDGGTSDADASVGTQHTLGAATAQAAPAQPQILTRAQWGADESLRTDRPSCVTPDYSDTIKIGFVHHTDTPNGYSEADVPQIMRSIYAYHTQSNGWCDIGYNFLVDRFGRIWEGRYGGIDQPVIGAHTGGFNRDSFAASLIGNYQTLAPPAVMLDAVERLFAWKLGRNFRDPNGQDTLVSAGGGTDKWPTGQSVTFNVIAGHRDAGNTTCPGDAAYADLPAIRAGVSKYLGAGLLDPSVTPDSTPVGGTPVTVASGALSSVDWKLAVTDDSTGAPVRTFSGSAATSIHTTWDLRSAAGSIVGGGRYRLTLSGSHGSDQVLPWTGFVNVTAPALPPAAPAGFVALTPNRVLDTRTGVGRPGGAVGKLDGQQALDLHALGVAGVPASGVSAVALNLTATGATAATDLDVFPAGQVRPNASSLNLGAGQTAASLVIARVGSGGDVSIYNQAGSTDVIADVLGYYPSDSTSGSLYHPITPVRVVATPSTNDPLGAGESRVVSLAGRFGVPPAGATAAVLNVTAVRPSDAGYVAVRPKGGTGHTSSVNFVAGQIVPNRVVTALSPDGAIELYNPRGRTDVLVDLVGWYGARASGGSSYVALTPARVLDTRKGVGAPGVPVGASQTIGLTVAGHGGVPASGATAVVLTLTATNPSAPESFVSAWPGGLARPGISDLNLIRGSTVANLVVVPVGAGGTVSLFNKAGSTDLVADVLGYYIGS